MPPLSLRVTDRDGNPLAEMPAASGGDQIVTRLNQPGSTTIGVGVFDLAEIYTDGREIQAWVAGETAPRAVYVPWQYSKSAGARRLSIPVQTVESLLARRYVNDEGGDLLFDDVDQHNIGWGLIDYSQDLDGGDLSIDAAAFGLSGVARDRTYLAVERPNVLEALTALTRLVDGFDWAIVPVAADRKEWTPWYPSRGADQPEWELGFGKGTRGNIIDYGYTCDLGRRATVAWAAGQGDGSGRLVGGYVHPDVVAGSIDRLEASIAVSTSIVDAATVDSHAQAEVEARVAPVVLLSDVLVASPADLPAAISVGDRLPVRINDGAIQVDQTMRVVQTAYRPIGDDVTLHLETIP